MASNSTIVFDSDNQRRVARAVIKVEKIPVDLRGVPVKRVTRSGSASSLGTRQGQVFQMNTDNSNGWLFPMASPESV